MDRSNSDSDFEDGAEARRQESSSASLRLAINRARRYIRKARTDRGRRASSSFSDELSSRFPCHSRSAPRGRSKKRKVQQWKLIPVCLQSPQTLCVPTKGVLDSLCKLGLGSKWFTNDDKVVVNLDTSADEFHFLLLCLFPQLRGIPYEICKAMMTKWLSTWTHLLMNFIFSSSVCFHNYGVYLMKFVKQLGLATVW